MNAKLLESFAKAVRRYELDLLILGLVLNLHNTLVDASAHERIQSRRPLAQGILKLVLRVNLELFPERV